MTQDASNDPERGNTIGRRRVLLGGAVASVLGMPTLRAHAAERAGEPEIHIELHSVADQVAVLAGAPTQVWRYRARLLRGPDSTLHATAGGWLGPIIRVRRGQRIRIDLVNDLPESTIIHWHGLHVPESMDGHPRFAIEPGARYRYEFVVDNRAGSYWFHPHPHGRTGKQVYAGLTGLFLVGDEEEDALNLPAGAQDLPLVIQDRTFDADNQLVYLAERMQLQATGDAEHRRGMGGMGAMMARMMGMLGDRILVNGQPSAAFELAPRAHRLRVLNGSNSRIYKLAWHDGSPLTVIGTDGGLLAAPIKREHVLLGPAERLDLWLDLAGRPAGSSLTLRSLAFDNGMGGGMMGRMMGSARLPDGAAFDVLTLRVQEGPRVAPAEPPRRLSTLPAIDLGAASNAAQPKRFDLTMARMKWGINGRSFEMLEASALETVRLGSSEVWEFRNDGAGMMTMAHAMHVHGLQFRVLGRWRGQGAGDQVGRPDTLDDGWKDTVLLMPGERVRILLRFTDHAGLFLYHCHMLEHEDTGLMRNYRVLDEKGAGRVGSLLMPADSNLSELTKERA